MDRPHPSRDISGSSGGSLAGRLVVLGVTGSVAAVRSPEIARLLMRQGADVVPVMSESARKIIHPDLMHWATGNDPIIELTGAIEHVALAGNVEGKADLVLIAPATANTIGKIAAAIDDTPVTTLVTTAIGEGIPLIVVPAMHEPMYRHPLVSANIARLEEIGVHFIMPHIEEGKAKIADNAEIVKAVVELVGERAQLQGSLRGRRVLVTAGRTVEYLDPVRVITNNSSGKMGIAVAAAAREAGAEVILVAGKLSASPPPGIRVVPTETAEDMARAVEAELSTTRCDVFVAAAAVGDWKPKKRAGHKVSTHGRASLQVELVPTEKIIDGLKTRHPGTFLVAFRALAGMPPEELIADAYERLKRANADLIAVNEVTAAGVGFETDTNELYFIDPEKNIEHVPLTSKRNAAVKLVAAIARRIAS